MARSLRAAVSGAALTAQQRAAHDAAVSRVLNGVPRGRCCEVSADTLADSVGVSAEQARRHLLGLVGRGRVKREKIGHAWYYWREHET